MARQRRGGLRPPELRGTLGTLLRTTLQQAGVVRDAARDVLERGAREGRSRLDEARSSRRRADALAELGELVLDLIRRGEIDLAELPEAKALVRRLDELDEAEADQPADVARAPHRSRFDDRDRDDGTVSASRWTPPGRSSPAAPRVWRPPVEPPAPADTAPPRRPRPGPVMPRNPHSKGGISFEDDDDLTDYMHPDDVPAKPPDDGEA